jgi:hypothetical protein
MPRWRCWAPLRQIIARAALVKSLVDFVTFTRGEIQQSASQPAQQEPRLLSRVERDTFFPAVPAMWAVLEPGEHVLLDLWHAGLDVLRPMNRQPCVSTPAPTTARTL